MITILQNQILSLQNFVNNNNNRKINLFIKKKFEYNPFNHKLLLKNIYNFDILKAMKLNFLIYMNFSTQSVNKKK